MAIANKRRVFWGGWFPLILYAAAIFIQSSFPSPESLPSFAFSDKWEHLVAYAVMGGLFFRAFSKSFPGWGGGRLVFFSILCTTLYGVSDELHQAFVPERMADGMDVVADFLGGILGVFCLYFVRLKRGGMSASISGRNPD